MRAYKAAKGLLDKPLKKQEEAETAEVTKKSKASESDGALTGQRTLANKAAEEKASGGSDAVKRKMRFTKDTEDDEIISEKNTPSETRMLDLTPLVCASPI